MDAGAARGSGYVQNPLPKPAETNGVTAQRLGQVIPASANIIAILLNKHSLEHFHKQNVFVLRFFFSFLKYSLQKQHDSLRQWLQNKEKQSVVSEKVKQLLKDLQDER